MQKLLKRVKQARKHCGLRSPLWAALRIVISKAQEMPFGIWPSLIECMGLLGQTLFSGVEHLIAMLFYIPYEFCIPSSRRNSQRAVKGVILLYWKGTNLTLIYAAQQWQCWE